MLGFALASVLPVVTSAPVYAQTTESVASAELQNQAFFKKKYRIKGSWSLVERDGKKYVQFSDDFKTKNGLI